MDLKTARKILYPEDSRLASPITESMVAAAKSLGYALTTWRAWENGTITPSPRAQKAVDAFIKRAERKRERQ